ncbi:M48 family metalloprotease [Humidisolicoccus flavus]|uniref:M48 family metalloprotease n=1 Tax=Humidisolicoccus flavus TaxID=3111414 RepID=UPI00324B3165
MYSAIARNKWNTVWIIAIFILVIGALGLLISYFFDPSGRSWLIVTPITIVVAGLYALLQYFTATKQALTISGGREIGKQDDPRLYRMVENLAIAEGMPMPKVFIIEDPSPNAFATGRDPEHAVVAATTGLLQIMDNQELEGVLAHEMAHVKNYDIRVTMIAFGLSVAIGLIADLFLRFLIFGGRNRGGDARANIIFLVLALVGVILAPLVAVGIRSAVSRQREYLADATGALTTRNPEGLARALEKLQAYARPMKKNHSSMEHLWISSPAAPKMLTRLFNTHPPLENRIARLRGNADRF